MLLRAAVLGGAGAEVEKAIDLEEAAKLIERESWDVLVICHSVGDDCASIAAEFRQKHPTGKVVVITDRSFQSPCAPTDRAVAGIDGPAALIKAVLGAD